MEFGQNLSKYRSEKGITQEQLSDSLGISRDMVAKYESGHSVPPLGKFIHICRILEVDPAEFLGFRERNSTLSDNESHALNAYRVALKEALHDVEKWKLKYEELLKTQQKRD